MAHRLVSAIRRISAIAVLAMLVGAGCTHPATRTKSVARAPAKSTPRIEAVAKRDGEYQLLGNGRVRILARGEFVLDHQDSEHLYIAIYPVQSVVPSIFPTAPAAASETPVQDKRGTIGLIDISKGLPHAGQWRDNFAVGDLLGDGSTQLVFAPPRKSRGAPVVFREQVDGWQQVTLRVPPIAYDYGGAAIADVDGDGRNDLVLAMHLTGFSALRAEADGTFSRFDPDLPHRGNAGDSGSGVAVLALPAPRRTASPLLLLREAFAPRDAAAPMPALAVYRHTVHGFVAAPLPGAHMGGARMAFAPSSTRCKAKLAIGSAYTGPPPLFETADGSAWKMRAIEAFPDPMASIGAVALGDADADGCSDLAVAYSRRIGNAWHSVIDIYLDRGKSWQRINLLNDARGARVTAMTFAAGAKIPGRSMLLTLDDDGTLRVYQVEVSTGALLLQSVAPNWRHGCAGSDIHVLPPDSTGNVRIAASFAGEPVMGAFDRCRNGGGIEAWRLQ